jgi:small subunit ribosomal protein S8
MTTDPIADYLTRIRNALKARHGVVEVPASNTKKAITKVLHEKGYIKNYQFDDRADVQRTIKIVLKYTSGTERPAILKLQRVSKPGLRKYAGYSQLPEVINGLGIAILSTSKGIMSDKEARKMNIGGEVLCYVY